MPDAPDPADSDDGVAPTDRSEAPFTSEELAEAARPFTAEELEWIERIREKLRAIHGRPPDHVLH